MFFFISTLLNKKKEIIFINIVILIFIFHIKNFDYRNMFFLLDNVSLVIIVTTLILSLLIIRMFMPKFLNFILHLLLLSLIFCFMSNTILSFYIFFELSIIPIFVIIFYKGKQIERITARIYLIFYTLLASFPFLLFVLSLPMSQKI